MEYIKDCRSVAPTGEKDVEKATLFRSHRLLLGLNTVKPGGEQAVHTHDGQDKFYHVLEGRGSFTVGDHVQEAGPGEVIWAPSEVEHGVRNPHSSPLLLLVGIAPAP